MYKDFKDFKDAYINMVNPSKIISEAKSGVVYEKDQYYPIVKYSYSIEGGAGRGRTESIKTFLGIITKSGDKEGFDTPKEANDVYAKFKKSIFKAKEDSTIDNMYMVTGDKVDGMVKGLTNSSIQNILTISGKAIK